VGGLRQSGPGPHPQDGFVLPLRSICLIPLLVSDAGAPDYPILEEALGQGSVEIAEVSHGRNVQTIKLINKSVNKLCLVDEEECGAAHARLGWPLVQRRLGQFQSADSVC